MDTPYSVQSSNVALKVHLNWFYEAGLTCMADVRDTECSLMSHQIDSLPVFLGVVLVLPSCSFPACISVLVVSSNAVIEV